MLMLGTHIVYNLSPFGHKSYTYPSAASKANIAFNTILKLSIISTVAIAQQDSEMTLVPGGELLMGNDMKNGLGFSPVHKVKVNSFYIDKYELTNKDYLTYPVVGVSFSDAKKYA